MGNESEKPAKDPKEVKAVVAATNPAKPTTPPPTIPVSLDQANGSKNEELKKYYTFNETGNIMLATTADASADIQESVRKVFAEVSVFFAAMTKAISSAGYSLYNYKAMEKIIAGSGCFIKVTEVDVKHTINSQQGDFSKELLEGLLGLATGTGALSFAKAMVSSVGKEGWRVAHSTDTSENKVGNIVFVCEYLLGMPNISAIVVYFEAKSHTTQLQMGPCFSATASSQNYIMHKDTYMFVTPTFIHQYAGDLNSITTDAAYGKLVEDMAKNLARP